MVDLSKLKKKKNRFGTPPTEAETPNNLNAPETAPATPKESTNRTARKKTGRTETFGTRVTPEFLKKVKRIAFEDELKIVELLEKAVEAYEKQTGRHK